MRVDTSRRLVVVLAVVLAGSILNCAPPVTTGDGGVNRCTTDATNSCACIDGTMGVQRCRADGTYGACMCGTADSGVDVPMPVDHVVVDTGPDVLPAMDVQTVDGGIDVMDASTADAGPDVVAVDVPLDVAMDIVSVDVPRDVVSVDVPRDVGPMDTGVDVPVDVAMTDTGPSCGHVVISQVYGAGGNSGAIYTNDFVELHNTGNAPVDITGWSIQYASAAGNFGNVSLLTPLTGVIPAGGYFLLQGAGGATGMALPTADATGATNMSGTAGKVALVQSSMPLAAAVCPTGQPVADFVGYGTTASCFEGSGAAPAASATNSVNRAGSGCTDTDDNAMDFATAAPNPRNSGAAAFTCMCGG